MRPLLALAVAGDTDASRLLLVPHPLWSRAFAELALRTTTRQWLNRTKPSRAEWFDETMVIGSRDQADDLIETLAAEGLIGVLRRLHRLRGHTVTALRLVGFYGETIGANERCPNAQAFLSFLTIPRLELVVSAVFGR
jgi:hypothetical protein